MLFIGEIAALSAALFWSWNSVVLTEATNKIGSISVNVYRMILASIYLYLTILIFNLNTDVSNNQLLNLIISAIFGLVLGDTFLFLAYKSIGPRISMLLMSFAPPISAVLAFVFLDEILSVSNVIGIAVTMIGIYIVIFENKQKGKRLEINLKGILYGFLASLGQASGLIFVKIAFNEENLNEFNASFIRLFSAVIILTVGSLIFKKLKTTPKSIVKDKKLALNLVWASLLGPYFGITASMIAVSHTYVGIASTLMSTVPIIMLPISKFYYKEKLNWKSILGAFITVVGVSFLFLW